MKNFVSLLCAVIIGALPCRAQQSDSICIMFWNAENFFDNIDGGNGESDTEFSAGGERHWTAKRFRAKCNAIAKAVLWQAGRPEGAMPDILSFAEIENRRVLEKLLDYTILRKFDYEIVHYDSPDSRGIDVALLYRKSRLTLESSRPVALDGIATRDILEARFVTGIGDSLSVMVNHHPSKYGGKGTDEKRKMALEKLGAISDSLATQGWLCQVAVGDFNEDAADSLFRILPLRLENMGTGSTYGSIRFDGRWQIIDNAFVTAGEFTQCRFEVVKVPFLTVRDTIHPGEKPLRTYSGPRYLGGVSDHYPVCVYLKY